MEHLFGETVDSWSFGGSLARLRVSPLEELASDTRFCNIPVEDEDVFHKFYERCGRQLNVPLAAILNRMPFYRCRGGVRMMNSRRLLAHFLLQADRLFEAHDVRMEIETVASLAETMRQGRCVSSGVH